MQSSTSGSPRSKASLEFGPFRLSESERSLEFNGERVRLGSRPLDILIVLADNAGVVVSQSDLIAKVWPGINVEAGGLRVHINTLRKALDELQPGARYIETVPGRGYCFVARVSRASNSISGAASSSQCRSSHNLLDRPTRIFGREEDIDALSAHLAKSKLVTVVGPGGVGKTTVATAVGFAEHARRGRAVRFVDLSNHSDSHLAFNAVLEAFDLPTYSDPLSGLLTFLRDKEVLLILDNCEHLANSVTELVESVRRDAPQTHILATSREPLRAQGEQIYPLHSLAYPPAGNTLTAAQALEFSSVQLFVDRAAMASPAFQFSDRDAPIVADICRKTDGVALAIELASSRVGALGLRQISELLDSRIKLLWRGRRTAPQRHQTLQATLDWSWQLLSGDERTLFNRLSVFSGKFTIDAIRAVAVFGGIDDVGVVEHLTSLVEKSLVTAEVRHEHAQYSLLKTSREFAQMKVNGEEAGQLYRRLANYCRSILGENRDTLYKEMARGNIAQYAELLNDIRSSLQWSFSPAGDINIGGDITFLSTNLFLTFGLSQQCRHWTMLALAALSESERGTQKELALQAAFAASSRLSTQDLSTEARDAYHRGIEIAQELGASREEIVMSHNFRATDALLGKKRADIDLSRERTLIGAKAGDPFQLIVAHCTVGMVEHMCGNYCCARDHFEIVLQEIESAPAAVIEELNPAIITAARAFYAANIWLRGFPDAALEMFDALYADYEHSDQLFVVHNICFVGSLVHQWRGDWLRVKILRDRLAICVGVAGATELDPLLRLLDAATEIFTGDVQAGVEMIRAPFMLGEPFSIYMTRVTCLTEGLLRLHEYRVADALVRKAIIEEARQDGDGWKAVLYRLRGVALIGLRDDGAHEAEEWLSRSMAVAKAQSAIGWELQAATSLAKFRHDQGRTKDAVETLAPVYQQFSEGFDTHDLMEAKGALKSWGWNEIAIERPGGEARMFLGA